ncbi:MAG TPA: aminotransferase class IV, partial [Bacteroidales bacterium]|nr:aminotransferase class IV [Bacteroidales bacterium]
MDTVYFNGKYLPREQVMVSPDDRGFLFGDSVYEVVRWYGGYFFDMEGHLNRLKRSLGEVRIDWPEAGSFPEIARELIHLNDLGDGCTLVYLQVTRGAAPRAHAFPEPPVP